ncbi:MAG: hypothetical protein ACYS4W_12495 [Planctomycetota bacterium]
MLASSPINKFWFVASSVAGRTERAYGPNFLSMFWGETLEEGGAEFWNRGRAGRHVGAGGAAGVSKSGFREGAAKGGISERVLGGAEKGPITKGEIRKRAPVGRVRGMAESCRV